MKKMKTFEDAANQLERIYRFVLHLRVWYEENARKGRAFYV